MRDFTFNDETMYVDVDGYPRFKDSDMLVHRWVMSKKKGRHLDPEEVVHHNDGDKMNFHPANLRLFKDQDAHERHHQWKQNHLGGWHGDGEGYSSSGYSGGGRPLPEWMSLKNLAIAVLVAIGLVVLIIIGLYFGITAYIDFINAQWNSGTNFFNMKCCPIGLIIVVVILAAWKK